jgi:hypothetical protein
LVTRRGALDAAFTPPETRLRVIFRSHAKAVATKEATASTKATAKIFTTAIAGASLLDVLLLPPVCERGGA